MIRPFDLSITQDDVCILIKVQVEKSKINTEQVDPDLCVDSHELIFSAEPYYLKLKFNEPLIEGGPQMFIKKNPEFYIISVAKLNYKEVFTGIENPSNLI